MNSALNDTDRLRATDQMMCRSAIGLAIVGLLIAGVVLLYGLLQGDMVASQGRLVGVGALCMMAGAGLLALYAAPPYRGGRAMRVIGTILLALAGSGWFMVLFEPETGEQLQRFAFNVLVLTVWMVGVMVVHRCEAVGGTSIGIQIARWAARISWFALAILLTVCAFLRDRWGSEAIGVSVFAAAVCGILSAAMVSFIHTIESRAGSADVGALPASMTFRFACPGCGESLTVLPGRMTTCGSCRTHMRIDVEEPRCVCGYLIYRLRSDTCPECGALISTGQRWLDEPTDEDQIAETPQRTPSSTDDSATV